MYRAYTYAGFGYAWIGAQKQGNDWEWVTGEAFDYNLWAEGEPSNKTKAFLVGDDARGGVPGTWIARSPTTNATGYFLEVTESPDPTNPDTDGDGILDGDEEGAICETIIDPFIGDTDKDGWKDETEVLFGSSPDNAKSVPAFKLKLNVLEGNQLELLFPGEKGTRYVVQTSDDMKTWVTLIKLIIGQGNTISERFSISGGLGFYRIQRE